VILLVLLAFGAGGAVAQSHDHALRDLGELAARVDQAHATAAPGIGSPLTRQRTAWLRLQRTRLACAATPTVNGNETDFAVANPRERADGLDFTILSRGLALTWDGGARSVSLFLSQRFDARNGEPKGGLFLEGGYGTVPEGVTSGVVGPDRWLDSPRRSSSPPLHQPWGAYLSALVRHIRTCGVP